MASNLLKVTESQSWIGVQIWLVAKPVSPSRCPESEGSPGPVNRAVIGAVADAFFSPAIFP